jgi:hypothetical protein
MGKILLQKLDSSFVMGELGGWNFGVGDLFPSKHWFSCGSTAFT